MKMKKWLTKLLVVGIILSFATISLPNYHEKGSKIQFGRMEEGINQEEEEIDLQELEEILQ